MDDVTSNQATTLTNDGGLEMDEQKRLDRPDREQTVEECMPTLERFEVVEKQVFFPIPCPSEFSGTIRIYASTMSREAIRKALALFPDIEEAKREERKRIIDLLQDLLEMSEKNKEPSIEVRMVNVLQALKEVRMKLKCKDCNWVGFPEECTVSFEPVPFTEGDVEPYLVCPCCKSSYLVPLGEEVQLDT